MKNLIKNKKIVIIDVETSGLYCGEDGKRIARILRVDATKIENGVMGESFSSLVACGEYIPKNVSTLTGISNKTLKGAPRIKAVLKQLKEFTCGYEVYARNSEFVNKFLSYYGNKNGIEIPMAMYDCYDDISKFLHERDIADCLEDSEELDVIKYAKALIKNIDNYSVAFRE